MTGTNPVVEETPPKGRLIFGGLIVVIGQLCPLLVPILAVSPLSAGWKAGLSGVLLFGVPELFILAGVAVLGNAGFLYLKRRLFGFLRRYAPPEAVSRTRYRIGLVMFLLPILLGWLQPYVGQLIPEYEANRFLVSVAGDLLLLASLFVLGGQFWDKLRALFLHGATAILPAQPAPKVAGT